MLIVMVKEIMWVNVLTNKLVLRVGLFRLFNFNYKRLLTNL